MHVIDGLAHQTGVTLDMWETVFKGDMVNWVRSVADWPSGAPGEFPMGRSTSGPEGRLPYFIFLLD